MPKLVEIYRFSIDGFVPKNQKHHRDLLKEFRNPPRCSGLNEYQTGLVMASWRESLIELQDVDFRDWSRGVFVFVGGLPESHWVAHELNHLKDIEKSVRRWFKSCIGDSNYAYSPYGLIPKKYTIAALLSKYGNGTPAYIPEKYLVISDVSPIDFERL